MLNSVKKIFRHPSYSRTIALVGIFFLLLAIPVTVIFLQQRTQTNQHASICAGQTCAGNIDCGSGFYCDRRGCCINSSLCQEYTKNSVCNGHYLCDITYNAGNRCSTISYTNCSLSPQCGPTCGLVPNHKDSYCMVSRQCIGQYARQPDTQGGTCAIGYVCCQSLAPINCSDTGGICMGSSDVCEGGNSNIYKGQSECNTKGQQCCQSRVLSTTCMTNVMCSTTANVINDNIKLIINIAEAATSLLQLGGKLPNFILPPIPNISQPLYDACSNTMKSITTTNCTPIAAAVCGPMCLALGVEGALQNVAGITPACMKTCIPWFTNQCADTINQCVTIGIKGKLLGQQPHVAVPSSPPTSSETEPLPLCTGNCSSTESTCTNGKQTAFSLNIHLPGIGNGQFDNHTPKHPDRNGSVDVVDQGKKHIHGSKHKFSHNNGIFGIDKKIDLGKALVCGNSYSVNVIIPMYLPAAAKVSYGDTNQTIDVTPIPGDINIDSSGQVVGDGKIDIQDYNLMKTCRNQDPVADQTINNNGTTIHFKCGDVINLFDYPDGGTQGINSQSGVDEWATNYNLWLTGFFDANGFKR